MDDFGEGKRFLYEEYGPGARDQRLETFAQASRSTTPLVSMMMSICLRRMEVF